MSRARVPATAGSRHAASSCHASSSPPGYRSRDCSRCAAYCPPMAEHAGVVRRREDPRLITGAGQFVDDLRVPGCLHAAMLRSPHAHARVNAIDVSAAKKAPGVVGVFTGADLGPANAPLPIYAPHPALPVPCRMRPLASDVVRFVGEPVVAVVADDPYRAHDALDLIAVTYEPLPAVVDVEAALAPAAPVLHDEVGGNVVAEWCWRSIPTPAP